MTIGSQSDIDGLQRIGRLVAQVREAMLAAACPGMTTGELDLIGERLLAAQGAQRERIETLGAGKNYPIASNDTEAGRAQNRRVEIRVIPLRS